MPAKSKQQQKFMGIVRAIQKGEAPASKFSKAAQKLAKSMKKSSVKKYAKTKHDDLPNKVKEDRDYKDEYKKFQSSTKAKKYRAELNKYNRQKGTYGNGDGKDASHKGGKIVGFESQSKNRGRAEKSRLKKEAKTVSIDGEELMNFLMKRFKMSKKKAINTMKKHKMDTSFLKKEDKLNEIPGSVMGAIQTATMKNPKTGRMNKMSTALADKGHPGHKKAKGFLGKLMDKFKKKKKEKPKKQSKADADFYKKQFTGEDKLREYIRGEIVKIKESMNETPYELGGMKVYSKADGLKKVKSMQKTDGAKIYKVTKTKTKLYGKHPVTMYNLYTKNKNHSTRQNPYGLDMMKGVYLIPVKESVNERAWTPDQTKAVDKVDDEFNKLMAKKGIEPYSVEAARLWKSAGFDKKMGKIFGKKEGVNEAINTQQANILMKQLGGRRFEMMMGVKSKAIGKDGLILHIGKNPKGVSHIIIDYDRGSDLYNIRFGKIRMNRYNDIKKLKGIAVDQLDNAIEKNTGLYTRF